MDRLACVNVASFPLQLLLRDHPDWAAFPAVVVEDDKPQSPVLFLNAHAHRLGVCTGLRYATALALARDLHAGTMPQSTIDDGVRTLADRLRRYSPHVEPSTDVPGVFWLDASGLSYLYPELQAWADRISADLASVGMKATIAVGFSRFGVYALAISQRGIVMCATAGEERTRVRRVPLSRLSLDPDARDRLLALGINNVGDFLRLPPGGLRARFGPAIEVLHQLASGVRWAPLVPVPAEERHERTMHFDAPESNTDRLVFVIKSLLDGLVMVITRVDRAVIEVVLRMTLDDRTIHTENVKPAAATLDTPQLLALIRLRLDTLQLSAGVVSVHLTANTCRAPHGQRQLLPEQTRRDTDAANRALARLRAECGEQHVVRAHIRDAHLPSARFTWEPLAAVAARALPRVVPTRPLVRRIYTHPVALPGFSLEPEDEVSSAGVHRLAPTPAPASVARSPSPVAVQGPYVVSGGWWGGGVERDYYFVHTPTGELRWIYYDRRRHRFYLQGHVQ